MTEYYIWLHEMRGMAPRTKKRLLEYFGSPEAIYMASTGDLPEWCAGMAGLEMEAKKKGLEESVWILRENEKHGIGVMTTDDPVYGAKADTAPGLPMVLYYSGRKPQPGREAVAIVGTRKATQYGIRAARFICSEYVAGNWIIVSGMALGIDSAAHHEAVEKGGITLGFVAHGLDVCYPREN